MSNRLHPVMFSGENITLLKEILEKSEEIQVICGREMSGIWLHDESFEMELRLLLLGNVRLIISRVQFIHRRHGTMTKVYQTLEQFCRDKGVQEISVQCVLTKEMANWCLKNGFEVIPSAGIEMDGFISGDYIKKLA